MSLLIQTIAVGQGIGRDGFKAISLPLLEIGLGIFANETKFLMSGL
jgi:hypothetical protein